MGKVEHTISVTDGGHHQCSECRKIIKQEKKIFSKAGIGGLFGGGCCSMQCFNAKYN